MPLLEIRDLCVEAGGRSVLERISLSVERGLHVVKGPEGSGKSTLAGALMGSPEFSVTHGTILFKGEDMARLSPAERARKGLFLGFQNPQTIPGVRVDDFLLAAARAKGSSQALKDFRKDLRERMQPLGLAEGLASRAVNEGFSEEEKKLLELLQMACLSPDLAVLDEPCSGLGEEASKRAADFLRRASGEMGILILSRGNGILEHLESPSLSRLTAGRLEAG